jgi:hypothetical protein
MVVKVMITGKRIKIKLSMEKIWDYFIAEIELSIPFGGIGGDFLGELESNRKLL